MHPRFFRTNVDYISRRNNLINLSNQKQSAKLSPEVELLLYCAHPQRDVLQAKNLLFTQGYRLRDLSAAQAQEAAYLREDYEYRFVLNDDQLNTGNDRGFFFHVVVGLHWRVTPPNLPFSFKAMRVWDHLEEVPLDGSMVLSLAPEDLLLLLCLHGTKHRWERLAWICDIAALVSAHQEMDWDCIVKQAKKLGAGRMLFLGLGLTHNLLDTDLPQNVVRRIDADFTVQSLLVEVSQRLFLSETNDQNEDSDETFVYVLRSRERILDRIKAYRHIGHHYRWMTPYAIDQAVLQLPPSLNILYYIFWPLRFVVTYVMSPARYLLR